MPILILVELKEDALPASSGPAGSLRKGRARVRRHRDPLGLPEKRDPDARPGARERSQACPKRFEPQGWPKLDDVRGLVMFALDNEGASARPLPRRTSRAQGSPDVRHRRAREPRRRLVQDQQSHQGPRPHPEARHATASWSRTRADADTVQSRKNDVTQRDKALSSGAQFVSTDYALARPAVLGLLRSPTRRPGRPFQSRKRRSFVGRAGPGNRQARSEMMDVRCL